jgi:hypothetical protein
MITQLEQLQQLRSWIVSFYHSQKKDIPYYLNQFLNQIVNDSQSFCNTPIGKGIQSNVIEYQHPTQLQYKSPLTRNIETIHDFVVKMIPLLPPSNNINNASQNPMLQHLKQSIGEQIEMIEQSNFQCVGLPNSWVLLCQGIPIVEIIASLLLNEFYVQQISPHFLLFGGFSVCRETHPFLNIEPYTVFQLYFERILKPLPPQKLPYIYQYFIDYTIPNIIDLSTFLDLHVQQYKKVEDQIIDTVMISILHSLHLMQSEWNMLHNDLHLGNIYISFYEQREDSYSKSLQSKQYLAYVVDDNTYYIPNMPWIVKIGDLGFSSFSLPHFAGVSQGPNYIRSRRILHFNPVFPDYSNRDVSHHSPDYLLLFQALQPYHNHIIETIFQNEPMFQLSLPPRDLYNGAGPQLLNPSMAKSPSKLLQEYYKEFTKRPENITEEQIAYIGKNRVQMDEKMVRNKGNILSEVSEKTVPILPIQDVKSNLISPS